jgi:hypothetical protein
MVWRKISVGLTISNLLLYEIYDQIFARSYNAVCTAQGISVDRTPLWQILLAAILILTPCLAARRNGVLVFCVVLLVLVMLGALDIISNQLSYGFDPWKECFTFDGDNQDQMAGEDGYILMFFMYVAVTYPVCLVDVVWVWVGRR